MKNEPTPPEFLTAYRGSFTSMMRWPQLDEFWTLLTQQADDTWYIYAVGEEPPATPSTQEKLLSFIQEIDTLLHKEHTEE